MERQSIPCRLRSTSFLWNEYDEYTGGCRRVKDHTENSMNDARTPPDQAVEAPVQSPDVRAAAPEEHASTPTPDTSDETSASEESGGGRQADRRVIRTRRLLTNALIELSLENGYEFVTIRDITDRAGVGYATFFRHYSAKEALLADVLDAFLEELTGLILAQVTDPVTTGRIIFEHAQRHRELYLLLMDSRGSSDLLNRVHEVGREGIAQFAEPRPGSPVPFDVAVNHIITSFVSLIGWWLENDAPYPPEEMGHIFNELIMKPTRDIAFREQPDGKPGAHRRKSD